MKQNIDAFLNRLNSVETLKASGKVVKVIGLLIESLGPACSLGEICYLKSKFAEKFICKAEVVGFRDELVLLMAIGSMDDIGPGSEVIASGKKHTVAVSDDLLGRIVNGFGEIIDEKEELTSYSQYQVFRSAPDPLKRKPIVEVFTTGVRAIDSLLTLGKGQRVGIFAGSGVGKSTTLGMIAKNSSADINVISLIGERGREVLEFLERDLGEEAMKRSVVVVATSDQDALVRVRAAFVATTIAEYFRDKGKDVLLMMDSITRMCMAQREIGLTIGEPPTTKGYPPSVFSILPKLMERSGNNEFGSITALYNVLVEGDDMNDPISDASRGILDGHIILSRDLAAKGQYPAIDILNSISRLMKQIINEEHNKNSQYFRQLYATYKEAEDLISVGAYKQGTNPILDSAVGNYPKLLNFLKQTVDENITFEESQAELKSLFLH
jgi:flagellum-specific ATP synthase